MLTYAQKKYLFAIYRLGMNGSVISSSDVSRLVGVSKASTVKMTQRLSDEGYILKEPYGKISLTESGIKAASSLFTSSVILCDFLHKQVGIDQQEADQDAVKIVAQVSEKSVEKLVKFALGDAANA
jgi:iron dependent repressor, N-terminal DNA binding domain protein